MRIRLGTLRRIIREEVERNMRWTAGMVGGGNTDVGERTESPPWGLGTPEELGYEEENEDVEEEREGKGPALRAAERRA